MLSVLRSVLFVTVMVGCTASIRETLPKLTPTTPEPPQSDSDILMQLALRRAVVDEKHVPDYGLLPDAHVIVVLKRDSLTTPRILPVTPDVRFLLLSKEQIRDLADRHGHFVYVIVSAGRIAGDSAQAGATTTWAASKRNPGIIYMSGGSCAWQYRKRDGTWHYEKTIGCLII